MNFRRAISVSFLVPCSMVGCISGEDLPAPASSQGGNAGNVGGGTHQGGAIVGNAGGTRQSTSATGGTKSAGVGGASASNVGGAATNAGGTLANGTGGTLAVGVGGQFTTVIMGGTAATGGAPSTAVAPSSGLGVYLAQSDAITGSENLSLSVDIVNTASAPQDLSSVTMRYWYVDDGWGSAQLVMETGYVSIGYSNTGSVKFVGSVPISPETGADHYVEVSFTGALAAVNDTKQNDKFHVQIRLHTSNWIRTNVTNDYSAMSGVGYDDRITLYSAGTLIWGTEPGGSSPSGTGGAPSFGGSAAIGGTSALPTTGGSSSTGGTVSSGGSEATGGVTASGGDVSTGGLSSTGGMTSSGGDVSTGGLVSTGGESSTGGTSSTGGDSSSGGVPASGGSAGIGGDSGLAGDTSSGGITATGGDPNTSST